MSRHTCVSRAGSSSTTTRSPRTAELNNRRFAAATERWDVLVHVFSLTDKKNVLGPEVNGRNLRKKIMKNFHQLQAMEPPGSRVHTAVSNAATKATYRRVVAVLLVCLVLARHVRAVEEGFVTATFGNAPHVLYPGTLQVEQELLRFDLASLARGARVQRAILRFPFRSDWGGHTVVKLLPVGISEQCLGTDPPAHRALNVTEATKTWATDPQTNQGLKIVQVVRAELQDAVLEVSYLGPDKAPHCLSCLPI